MKQSSHVEFSHEQPSDRIYILCLMMKYDILRVVSSIAHVNEPMKQGHFICYVKESLVMVFTVLTEADNIWLLDD